jgi:hypothetical protein
MEIKENKKERKSVEKIKSPKDEKRKVKERMRVKCKQ